ncbi:NeuD/PglB/VioB family sugar acetyltransferase [Saccharomonospora sp. NPDC006951]
MSAHRLVVLGAGEFARQILGLIEDAGPRSYDLLGFVANDDAPEVEGVTVLGGDEVLTGIDAAYLIGVGAPELRGKLAATAEAAGLEPARLIHSAAWVDRRATVGPGSLVAECSHIQYGAVVGSHVVVNINAIVGHDCVVGDHTAIAGNVMIGARSRIGREVMFGMGSIVMGDVRVGDRAVVGAGAVVTHDVPPDTCVVGVPARELGSVTGENAR